jgi:hypothetical protein
MEEQSRAEEQSRKKTEQRNIMESKTKQNRAGSRAGSRAERREQKGENRTECVCDHRGVLLVRLAEQIKAEQSKESRAERLHHIKHKIESRADSKEDRAEQEQSRAEQSKADTEQRRVENERKRSSAMVLKTEDGEQNKAE